MPSLKRICAMTMATAELAALLLLATSPTQARYENTARWSAVYGTDSVEIQSNFLTEQDETALMAETDPGQINLLHEWTMPGSSRPYEIKIFSNASDIQAELTCQDNEYLTVELEEYSLILPTDGEDSIRMTLTPTEKALAITEPVTVTVTVKAVCQPIQEETAQAAEQETEAPEDVRVKILTGTFQVTLIPEEVEETEPPETTAPTEESTEPTGETEPPETTAPTVPDEGSATDPTDEGGIDTAAEEETEPTVAATEPPSGTLHVDVDNVFAKNAPLEWGFRVSDNTEYLVICAENDDLAGLRYRIDDQGWVMLADGGELVLQNPDARFNLTMDFSWVEDVSEVEFAISTYLGETRLCYLSTTLTGSRELLTVELDGIQPILSGNGTLSVPYSGNEEEWSWNLERLVPGENSDPVYIRDETGYQFGLKVRFTAGHIQISNASGSAPPGAYRLVLEQIRQNTVISTVEMPLFIHY